MKKFVSLILAGVMVLSLAACGGGKSTDATVTTTEPAGTEAQKETQNEPGGG